MAALAFRSQRVAYPYFLAALLLFVLQVAFGVDGHCDRPAHAVSSLQA